MPSLSARLRRARRYDMFFRCTLVGVAGGLGLGMLAGAVQALSAAVPAPILLGLILTLATPFAFASKSCMKETTLSMGCAL